MQVSLSAIGIVVGIALCAAVMSPVSFAATAAQKSACKTVLVLRGWNPPLALAGDVAPDQAVSLLRKHLAWQQKVVTATKLDPETTRIKNELWDAVRNFNLEGLYTTLPAKQDDWRSLTLLGHLTSNDYRVSKTGPDAFDNALTSLGDIAGQFAMRPRPTPADGPSGNHFEIRARQRANVGPIAWADVRKATWASLKHLTVAAPVAPPTSGGLVGGTGGQAEILLQLQPAFPNTYRWYLSIAEIPNLLANDSRGSRARHMHVTVQLDDGLRKNYPQVADYLDQIKGFISGDVAIESKSGRWLSLDFDSERERFTMDGWVLDGHLVPTRKGRPQIGAIDTDASLDSLSFQSVTNLQLTTLGVTVKLKDWSFDWQYQRTGKGADYSGLISQKPKVQVSGSALGFIPTGVVDVMIPNNIEGIVDDFMRVLTNSNDGKGATLDINYTNGSSGGSIVSAGVDANTLDNFFVKFAVSLVNKRIIPNSAQFEGLKRLANDGITSAQKDTSVLVAAQKSSRDTDLPALIKQCHGTP